MLLRRRWADAAWARVVLVLVVLSQGLWAAVIAGAAFSLADTRIGEPAGWGLAVVTFSVALVVVAALWLAEDALAVRSGATRPAR